VRSQEEITILAARLLERQYGDRVTVEFHDLNGEATGERFPEVVRTVAHHNLTLPVVQIERRLTPLPYLSYWAIVDLVENALAEQREAR
jgi:hypothetical protein